MGTGHMIQSMNDMRPDEYLNPAFLPEYEEKCKFIYNELVTTNCLLVYLDKIVEYSECLSFLRPEELVFAAVLRAECYQGVALRLWKLHDGALDYLCAAIRANLQPEYLDEFDRIQASTREARRRSQRIKRQIDPRRNNLIAHLNLAQLPALQLPALMLNDLKALFSLTKEYYESMSPGTESWTLPLAYMSHSGTQPDPDAVLDIDMAFRALLVSSRTIGGPEIGWKGWETFWSHMTSDEQAGVNRCRARCGLPER
jgi:hypothetical protein